MSIKKGKISMRGIWIALLSVSMVAGFIFLFVSASKDKKENKCEGIHITLNKKDKELYVDTAAVRKRLIADSLLNPVGKSLDQLQIPQLSAMVDSQAWVKDAEVYLGNHNLLYIKIKQEVPVARIFTRGSKSFYLDESGHKVPALGEFKVDLPVFTGYPKTEKNKKDSSLLPQVQMLSNFISKSPFWTAQIEQININKHDEFELYTQVGDALIIFGKGKEIPEKFNKLMSFYKNGLNKVGWGYYDTLDLRFKGQVVASRKDKEGNPVVNALVKHNDPDGMKELGLNINDFSQKIK